MCMPFALSHKDNPRRDALMVEIWVIVDKREVIPLAQESGPGFYCNLSLVTKVTVGGGGCGTGR